MQGELERHPFYLIGSGGLAREIYGWLLHEKHFFLKNFSGFLVTDSKSHPDTIYDFPVVHVDHINGNFSYLLTVGSPNSRRVIYEELSLKRKGQIESFISNDAVIGFNVSIGRGVIINPRSSISSDSIIGDLSLINCNTGIGHDVIIGENCTLLGSSSINGDVSIGNDVIVGSGVIIHPAKTIGDNAVLGIGSVVIRNVKPDTTVFGNPARVI